MFQVLKQLPEDRLEDPAKDVEVLKLRYGSDTAFKKDGMLYFCIKIEEAEIIE